MNYFSDTINLLPDEILFFKNITNKQKDPIKKYMWKKPMLRPSPTVNTENQF